MTRKLFEERAYSLSKFIYSEKAKKFCEIFPLLLTVCTAVESKGKILQNFVAFSEYMNFKSYVLYLQHTFSNITKWFKIAGFYT